MDYLKYFKQPGFNRFIIALKEKYESLGRFSGFIKLEKITEEESLALTKFFGENYPSGENANISLKKFEKVIQKSNIENFSYENLLKGYFNLTEITTKKDRIKAFLDLYEHYMQDLIKKIQYPDLKTLILENQEIIKIVHKKYKQDKKRFALDIEKIDKLLMNIPEYPTSLPIYASITSNPHYLDFNTSSSALFFQILCRIKGVEYPYKTEEKIALLESINVYPDAISNFVITSKLKNVILDKVSTYGPINLNLENIRHIDEIKGLNNKIYIFENPSILNYLKEDNVSIIITSGIPNLAFYELMKKITKDTQVYYNGDFDPEGLLIAEKIKTLFPFVNLLCYETEDYENTSASEKISESRIKKLNGIKSKELLTIKKLLSDTKKAGYQENNLKNIKEEIKKEEH